MQMKERTLVFLHKPEDKQILLALKKRGFGEGKWNGVGGKIEAGETIEQATVREADEEIGVAILPEDLKRVATIDFAFQDKPELNQRVHTFFTTRWEGEPKESEEMRPAWYAYEEIPYSAMWVDDREWLPRVLKGERLAARFLFTSDGSAILEKEIQAFS